ncbi:hypothetical protein JR316_0012248 [Psilocybe cubensis]|uniref:F-box domain-containing protein n=2 Tax=Psilocybe cubensis TaxID=181762 RepID=A0A8H7XQQ9_PSICU|nr:hypothetical protein JR316_0012248 [Psilocybe cubensis]KAH9475137.1 hypothetical protein JR316_0012248 [Psilocybe cubensis]
MSSSIPTADDFMDVDRDDVNWAFINRLLLACNMRLPSTTVVKTAPPNNDKLPAEILQEIFEYLVTPFEDAREAKQKSVGSQACIPVTQVCRFWRYTALAHSALWTNVASLGIISFRVTKDDILQQKEYMQTLLSLSKSRPLHIKHDVVESEEYAAANQLFAFLLRQNPPLITGDQAPVYHAGRMLLALGFEHARWETLDIVFDNPFLVFFLQKSHLIKAVNLKQLVIKLKGNSYTASNYEGLHQWISKLPNLDFLRVESTGLYSKLLFSFSLKVPNVELRRDHIPLCCCVDFLVNNTYSTSIILKGTALNGPTTPGTGPLCSWNVKEHLFPSVTNMTRLQNLTLRGIRGSINIFQFIRIPSLKTLEIYDGLFGINEISALEFATILSRQHCVLERLVIHNACLSRNAVLQMLTWKAIQGIKRVSLGPVPFSELTQLVRLKANSNGFMVFKDPSLGIFKLPVKFTVWQRTRGGKKDLGCFLGW